ncbi:protein-glutamate O-methyltransferase [Bryobacterales bacterium F-183]|nr:protein-glutamate O-methyltransferase [Bryobacterales bacterium F-183]
MSPSVSAILGDYAFPQLKEFVLSQTGLNYFDDKDADFAARLARRIKALDLASCGAYLAKLQHPALGPPEMERLVGELTIGETYFFRQMEHFDLLRTRILPEVLERKAMTRTLSIWSAGAATGAEAYSISILLKTEFAARLQGWSVSITGTDLNVDFLAAARDGVYSKWPLRTLSPELIAQCFEPKDTGFRIRPEYQRDVSFSYHNLVDGDHFASVPRAPFDIIICRNVMIYFSQQQNRQLIQKFHGMLQPGGWLIVGHAEYGGDLFPAYEIINAGNAVVYRKPLTHEHHPVATTHSLLPDVPVTPTQPAPAPPSVPPEVPIHAARALADRGEWAAAEQLCRDRLQADSLDCEAHFTLGLVLEHRGADQEAIREMRSAIYLDRGFAMAYYHLGLLLQRTGDVLGSRKAFRNLERLLAPKEPADAVEHGDGIQAQELLELARMQQEASA